MEQVGPVEVGLGDAEEGVGVSSAEDVEMMSTEEVGVSSGAKVSVAS